MSFCKIATACCVLFLALQSARAETSEAKERAARKACLLGDVAKGAEILADLYLDSKDPTHIYNQGRCFEQNGQNEAAILRFREYLRNAGRLSADEVAKVEKKIAELQEKERDVAPVAATPVVSQPVSPPPSALPESRDPLQLSQPAPAPAVTSAPVYKRWWFWGGIGAVVAGAVVATLLLTSGSSAKHSPPCATSGAVCVP